MSIKKDVVMPVVVLTVICIVISFLLALANDLTSPIIREASATRENDARKEIIPTAESFELIENEHFDKAIKAVYASTNDVGYVITVISNGYGGEMTILIGIDASGLVSNVKLMKHSETAGLGAKTADNDYTNQYIGKDKNLDGIEAITGATVSSRAFSSAVKDAFTAYELVKGAE